MRVFSLSPCGLRDSRKFGRRCEDDAGESGGEALPALSHGFGPRWFAIAVPAAVAGDDPGEPGERALWVGILLLGCGAFASAHEDGDLRHEGWIEDIAHGSRPAVAGIDEL